MHLERTAPLSRIPLRDHLTRRSLARPRPSAPALRRRLPAGAPPSDVGVFRRSRAAVVAFAVLVMLAATVPAPAQPSVKLLSNMQQRVDYGAPIGRRHAQEFTTGSNASGYKLTAVEFRLSTYRRGQTAPTYTVNIRSAHSPSNGPGGWLGTLSTPSEYTVAPRTYKFSSGTGIDLDPNTKYFAVIEDIGGGLAWVLTTSTGDQDSGAAAGWRIGSAREAPDRTWFWSQPRMFSVYGYAKPSPLKLIAGRIHGTNVRLYFNRELDATGTPAGSQFALSGSATTDFGAVGGVAISGTTIGLTTARAASATETVAVTVSDTTGIRDRASNPPAPIRRSR